MKRLTAFVLTIAVLVGTLPAALGAELPDPEGASVTWYTDCESLMRRYGTDRMLLVRNGLSGLFGLDGKRYTDCIFDAFGTFNGSGLAPACRNGKWGVVDLDGKTVVDFQYATQEEAAAPTAHFVSKWPDGSPPYALSTLDGKLLTDYKYWAYRPFSNGIAMVTDGASWGYVDERGREITAMKYSGYQGAFGSQDFGEDGFAIVYEGRSYNFIGADGRERIADPLPYATLWRAGQGLWGRGVQYGTVEFLNSDGEVVVSGDYFYRTNPKGIMQGNQFDDTGTAAVYLEDGTETRITIPVGEDALHEGLYRVQDPDAGLWGFMDEAGETVVPRVFDAVGCFDHGCVSVRSNGVYGLLKNPLLKEKTSDWAEAEVTAAAEAGYVTPGCAVYQTYAITREQFAELAVNYLEKAVGRTIAPAPIDTFADTTDETVRKAYAAGIVQGMGDGAFCPDGPLTREQLAAMLYRAMTGAGRTAAAPADLSVYADGGEVSSWAADSLSALVGMGIMAGTGENALSPQAPCTVEQAILLVYRTAAVSL